MIVENVVGLARFLSIVFSLLFLPRKRHVAERPVKPANGPLEEFIGPTRPLIIAEPVFCPECHVQVCLKGKDNGGTVILDNHRNIIRISNLVVVGNGGKKEDGFSTKCPNGHKVVIK